MKKSFALAWFLLVPSLPEQAEALHTPPALGKTAPREQARQEPHADFFAGRTSVNTKKAPARTKIIITISVCIWFQT